MLKRELSGRKLPKIAPTDSTLSSKLYSLTGLRIFQAKFMDELRYPKPKPTSTLTPNQNITNQAPKIVLQEGFSGKDRGNQVVTVKGKEEREGKQAVKVKILCGKPKGLRNLGNTCYLNAILQSLMALQQFNVSLEKELKLKKIEKGLSVTYAKLASYYRSCKEREVVTPADFKAQMGRRKDRFAGSAQQDAQEFLTAFLEGINEEMTRVKVKPKYKELQGDPSKDTLRNIADQWWNYCKQRDDSVVCDYFQGQSQCTILCSQCQFRSVSFDTFWGLPVSLSLKGSSLQQLLAANFTTEHKLEDYSCQKCKKSKTCSKTIRLFRLPSILVVQLKRFGYGWSRKQKIKDRISVPLNLSLKDVLSNDAREQDSMYRLKSTVQHSGELNFGHYTSHVYSEKDEKWYQADDDRIDEESVSKDAPELYLMFYSRK